MDFRSLHALTLSPIAPHQQQPLMTMTSSFSQASSPNLLTTSASSPRQYSNNYQPASFNNSSTNELPRSPHDQHRSHASSFSLVGGGHDSSAGRSPTSLSFSARDNNGLTGVERLASEYWTEAGVSSSTLDHWTVNLRRWLHGTIIQRLVQEIDSVNKQLAPSSGSGDAPIVGSTTTERLKQLQATKYSYHSSLPTLLAFLEFAQDQRYLVNRLRELSRGNCLDEFRWDAGSRSSFAHWKEYLPNDTIILFNLFATYMDTRMPVDPSCWSGRVFSQLCVVRQPDKPDLTSKYVCQFYQSSVQPPSFGLVINGKLYRFPEEAKNLYHAILLCFHYYLKLDGKFRGVNLGSSGLNIAWVFAES